MPESSTCGRSLRTQQRTSSSQGARTLCRRSTHELTSVRHSLTAWLWASRYSNYGSNEAEMLLRKEVIQPHLPVRLPCYDFVLIASPTFDGSLHEGWATGFGCYRLS